MKEIWKEILGYEGLYEVSNLGKVRNKKTGRILKLRGNKKKYWRIVLCKDGVCKEYKLHRLVAQAFLPNPQNFPQVNHKDENPDNNIVSNLEWCTALYNVRYSQAIPVLQYDLQGNFIREWGGENEAADALSIPQGNICKCCQGTRNYAGGFIWKYKN